MPRDCHPSLARRLRGARIGLSTALLAALATVTGAQIRTDNSLGLSAQTLAGPAYVVPQSIGKLAGGNLFHSFEAFNIQGGQSANFTTTTPTLANVISRVTGGTASAINGQLKLTPVSGAPNFFFINPAGVTFGAGASIDVPGAFHVSTANSLRFADGDFHADLMRASTFSSAAPQAFGFLGTTRAPITVKYGAALALDGSQAASLTAGDIEFNNGTLATASGNVRVTALGMQLQDVGLTGALPVTSGILKVTNGGAISSATSSSETAGSVTVSAGSVTIDRQGNAAPTRIASLANAGSGNAGSVEVAASGNLSVVNGGVISADTFSAGHGGAVRVSAANIGIDGQGSTYVTGIRSEAMAGNGNAGNVDVTTPGVLSVVEGSRVSASTASPGNAGAVTVDAGSVVIDGRGRGEPQYRGLGQDNALTGVYSFVLTGGSGNAGSVAVATAGRLAVLNGGQIAADGAGVAAGAGGSVRVSAANVVLDGRGSDDTLTGLTANSSGGSGGSGTIELVALGEISMHKAWIAAFNWGSGSAGSIKVTAGSLVLEGRDDTNLATGIQGNACDCPAAGPGHPATGHGVNVEVVVHDSLTIRNTARISSEVTGSSGNGGSIKVSAGTILVDGDIGFPAFATGIFSRTGSIGSVRPTTGKSGDIEVVASGEIALINGGSISTDTRSGPGAGGSIKVSATSILIDGQANGFAAIRSQARTGSTGNAGAVQVTASDDISLLNGGVISTSTATAAKAGSVRVAARNLSVFGATSSVDALARAGSSGQTGDVEVAASESILLANGGRLSIQNDATVANPAALVPTTLRVSAPDITLKDAQVTAASTGNVAASDIQISFTNHLFLDPSSITTSANLGNGGAIRIFGGKVITLDNSQITTSVTGLAGNGGNILVNADALVLKTGFIQANTGAPNAAGGLVTLNLQTLATSGNALLVGGDMANVFQPGLFGYNVIQAAAPAGLSGAVQITTPLLDVSGSLSGLSTQVIDTGGLGRNPCQVTRGSSLAQTGRGGLAPSARGWLRAEPSLAPPANAQSHLPQNHAQTRLAGVGCS